MFEAFRERLTWRRAHKLVAQRTVKPWQSEASDRRVLLVLPAEERYARAAWHFVESLRLNPARTIAIVPTGEIAFAPMSFMGRVRTLDPEQLDRFGLPRKAYLHEIWQFEPEVGICLMTPFDLASAIIVGASPAAFRIGFFDEQAESFFDLMITAGPGLDASLQALGVALARIHPPVISPSEAAPSSVVRSVWT